jgi:hypothetical protein
VMEFGVEQWRWRLSLNENESDATRRRRKIRKEFCWSPHQHTAEKGGDGWILNLDGLVGCSGEIRGKNGQNKSCFAGTQAVFVESVIF